ncbi:MAG TPA: iron-sulfur cluster assembly protein [Acidisarcina sp.]
MHTELHTTFGEEQVRDALRDVYDPELPVNIVDLGLIYRVDVAPDPDAPGFVPRYCVAIEITMTSQGCPSHAVIIEKVQNRLAGIREISRVDMRLVWEPPWHPRLISETARKQLGI